MPCTGAYGNPAQGATMSRTPIAAVDNASEQSSLPQAAPPTGYWVSIVPGAIEVSARLATVDELRGLVKALTASGAILSEGPAVEIDSLSKRLSKASAA
jgi:hypothetical protein